MKNALPGQEGKYFRQFLRQGNNLNATHILTTQEVQKYSLPASLFNRLAGAMRAWMSLAISTNRGVIRAEHDELGVDWGPVYHNGKPTNQYRINSWVPKKSVETWTRVK